MFDLEPATRVLTGLVADVRDDQLTLPTPCAETSLGDLLDHVDGLSSAFTAAATKTPLDGGRQGPSADAAMASAWREQSAWTGMTRAGGLDLPAEVAGLVALDEVIVHGWDIAVASGQSFGSEPQLVEAAYGFVQSAIAQNPQGTPGLFGPPVPVPGGAPLLDRLLGLTGRDPAWRAGDSHA